jgi:hypothetical protein
VFLFVIEMESLREQKGHRRNGGLHVAFQNVSLTAAALLFLEAFLAVDRTIPARLERNFALFLTTGTRSLMHLTRTAEPTATLKAH